MHNFPDFLHEHIFVRQAVLQPHLLYLPPDKDIFPALSLNKISFVVGTSSTSMISLVRASAELISCVPRAEHTNFCTDLVHIFIGVDFRYYTQNVSRITFRGQRQVLELSPYLRLFQEGTFLGLALSS